MNALEGVLRGLIAVLFIGIGLAQWAATAAGLDVWFGWTGFFTWVAAGILAYIPIIGTICGFCGAIYGWDWAWWQAGLLFFGTLVAMLAISTMGQVMSRR